MNEVSVASDFDIPVFAPSLNEFRDFKTYVTNLERFYGHFGIVKVIPPPDAGIKSIAFPDNQYLFERSAPHYQTVVHQIVDSGVYVIQNVYLKKSMTYDGLKKVARKHEPPSHENVVDREKRFWLGLQNRAQHPSEDPVYCILDHGTCFHNSSQLWNLSQFSGNESIIHALDQNEWFAGIHTPYLYLGMFGTSFAWHREDRNLCSISYLHHGGPKVWYAIPAGYAERLEEALQAEVDKLPDHIRNKLNLNCNLAVRHKCLYAGPSFLKKHSIPFAKVVQSPGQFIISFPGNLHSGFNCGENCAEAINFALETSFFEMYDDFKYGSACRSARKECLKNSRVKFDIEEISRICGKPIPISTDGMDDEDDMDDGETSELEILPEYELPEPSHQIDDVIIVTDSLPSSRKRQISPRNQSCAKKIKCEDSQLIAYLKEEKKRLEIILNRQLKIHASQMAIRKYKKLALRK